MTQIEHFGSTASGQAVQRISLRSESLTVSVLTLGAVLQSVRLKGVAYDLTLGSIHLSDYEGAMCYHGSVIAPVVNRITGAQACVAGHPATFQRNFLGKHCLHSGDGGTQHQLWDIADFSTDQVSLALHLPDGLGGFAGNRDVTARFSLQNDQLRLDVITRSDAPTLWNAANHSYWNLDGTDSFSGHQLQLAADHYLPTTAEFIPTGEIMDVSATPFDFRNLRPIAPQAPALDNCFCLGRRPQPMREVLMLRGSSGVTLRLSTTEAGVQLYDCRHDGYRALAIEAQNWPDAPHHKGFPDITLAAGAKLVQSTAWTFSKG